MITNKIKNYIKSVPSYIWILILVIAAGIFFRTYHFQDWLFLKGDQVRDVTMVSEAFDVGAGKLPLLGPRAGGTLVRLGPIFYYFQYISSLIFQSDQPPVLAYPTWLFSILTLPLFYYLVRKYFTISWSIVLVAMFSCSFMLIDYSRYAWNPNATPFFVILFLFSLLEIFSPENKHKYSWTVASAVSFAVATQLHFSAFVVLPIILVLFLSFQIKKIKEYINWKQIIIFLAIVLIFYTPVILSDVMNNGDNLKQFIDSVRDKSSSGSFIKIAVKEAYYFGKNFSYLLSSYNDSNKLISKLAQSLILLAFIANILLFKKEKEKNKKNFLLIILTAFSVFYLVYFPLAKEIDKSRFFLPLAPIPFIYLGFLFVYLSQYAFLNKYFLRVLSLLVIIILLGYNLHMDFQWMWAMNMSQSKTLSRSNSFALDVKSNNFWWSLSHFRKIANYLYSNCDKKDVYYLTSKNAREYSDSVDLAFSYITKDKSIHYLAHDLPDVDDACFYFVSQKSSDVSAGIRNDFIADRETDLGNVNILKFSFSQKTETSDETAVLATAENNPTNDTASADEQMTPVLDLRKPRQFWGDVLPFFFNKN